MPWHEKFIYAEHIKNSFEPKKNTLRLKKLNKTFAIVKDCFPDVYRTRLAHSVC